MRETQQMENMSVMEHGTSVWIYTQRILNRELEGFRIPEWLVENYDKILDNIHDIETIQKYNLYHDCGKPFCIPDKDKRFPDHANVSKQVWLDSGGNSAIGNLIGLDMLLHTATADEIKEKGLTIRDAMTLLITALAEVHSNAQMFGGIESNSFKAKWKKLNRRGKMLMKEYF